MKQSKGNQQKKEPSTIRNPRKVAAASSAVPDTSASIFIEKHAFLILLGLLFFIAFVVFKDFIFLKKVYLFKDIGSDSINIYLPYWVNIADYLRTDGIPQWSQQVGMGQNIYMFDMGNPFSLILYAVGRNNIPYFIFYVELLKIVLSGVVIYFYILQFKTSHYVAIIGALMYAFGGYIILGGSGWYHQSTEVFFAALFLFSVEKFLQNKWYWLTIAACLMSLWHAYFLFPYGLLLLLYLSFRYIDERGFNFKKHIAILFYGGCCFLLGALISSVFVINFLLEVYNSPRVSGGASGFSKFSSAPMFGFADWAEYLSFMMRTFSNDLIGNGNNYKGWGNYLEGPVLYIGLPSLLLFSQFFSGLTKERKRLYIGSAIFVLAVIIFPYFRYMFWGFALDYFRTFSFFISLFIFYLTIRSLNKVIDKNKNINLVALLLTLAACLIILYFNDPIKAQIIQNDVRTAITLFLFAYAALFMAYKYNVGRQLIKILFLGLLCIELIYFTDTTISKRNAVHATELDARIGYNDYTVDAVNYLKKNEKDPFYRVTKYFFSGLAMHGSMNDAMVQGYKSTICYSSFNQKYYIKFLEGINAIKKGNSNDVKWAMGVNNRPLLQSLVSCKYIIKKADQPPLDTMGFEKIQTFGSADNDGRTAPVDLYRNKTYVPPGVCMDRYITASDFEKMSDLNKDIGLFKAIVIPDSLAANYSDFRRMPLSDTANAFTYGDLFKISDSLKSEHLTIKELTNNRLEGSINTDGKKMMMLSFPFDEGWQLKVNGKPQPLEIINYGLMGIRLDKGMNTVSLEFVPPFKNVGLLLSTIFIVVFSLLFFFFRKKSLMVI